jgi:hypothetical protein
LIARLSADNVKNMGDDGNGKIKIRDIINLLAALGGALSFCQMLSRCFTGGK